MARPRPRNASVTAATAAATAPSGAASSTLTPRRRWLFAGLTLAFPWALLVLLELALRAGGYGGSYPLFVAYPDQPGWLVVNPDIGKRYFRGPFTPSPQVDFFRAVKAPNTTRVFFQGESSAAGFPYGHGGAPSRMLEAEYGTRWPIGSGAPTLEVINTALTAVNSYTLLDQADEIIAQHPDAVMIYTGHNEYYGAFGVASTRTLGRWPALVRTYLALRKLRTVQLIENALGARGEPMAVGGASAPTTVMELMAGEQRIPLGSRVYQEGLDQFRANLGELLRRYQAHHVPVVIGTLVSDERDQPPFISGFTSPADSVAWLAAARSSLDALRRGDSASAERVLAAAARGPTSPADAHYALARLYDAEARYDSARVHYRAAKEGDELRFRAPEAMNRIIREEAARYGAKVVETEQAFESASPNGIVGHSLILEHLHPNVDGYSLLAHTFFTAGVADFHRGLPPPAVRAAVPVTPVDSIAGWLRIDRLLAGWPFQPRGTVALQAVDTLHPHDEVERLAQALVRGSVSWPEAMDQQRAYFEHRGDADAAIRVARAMALEYPYSAQPYMDAARIAMARGDLVSASRFAQLANGRRESIESAELAATLLLRLGDPQGAAPFLQRASLLAPSDKRLKGAYAAARILPLLLERQLAAPRDSAVLHDLAVAYALTEQYDSARSTLARLRRVAPGDARAAALLANLPK